jgi:hypothetical protein
MQILPNGAAAAVLVILSASALAASPQSEAARDVLEDVKRIDEAYRVAKLNRDTQTLDRILANGFYETNQNGNSRDKAQMIELWKSFSISSLTTDSQEVRIANEKATVTGRQTEDGTERMLFMRIYVKGSGGWQLLASMQFRDPNPAVIGGRQSTVRPPLSRTVEDEVLKIDEAYRVAKLNRDTRTLDRILANGFYGTNQNGNSRDKAQMIELWKSFSISSLTTDSQEVRISNDTATVTGRQTEDGTDRMLFMRIYVKGSGGWQLLASMQFRDPNTNQSFNEAAR